MANSSPSHHSQLPHYPASGRVTPSGLPMPSGGSSISGRATPTGSFGYGSGSSIKRDSTFGSGAINGHGVGGGAAAAAAAAGGAVAGVGKDSTITPSSSSGSVVTNGTSSNPANSTSVQVALRIRPGQSASDASIPARFLRTVIHPTSTTSLSVESSATASANSGSSTSVQSGKPIRQSFNFDRVLGPAEGQQRVYEQVEPLIGRFLEGYNVTVLAYGQTGSGKSYSMGTDRLDEEFVSGGGVGGKGKERMGIVPRAVDAIFEQLNQKRKESGGKLRFDAKNTYIEIYNEDLIDLLAGEVAGGERPQVTIREDKNGTIIWSGLRERAVTNKSEVMANLASGSAIRQTNSTDMNSTSSRSHAIFSLVLRQHKFTGTGPPPPPSPNPSRMSRGFSTQPSRPNTPSGLPERPGSSFGLAPRPGSVLGGRNVSGSGERPMSPTNEEGTSESGSSGMSGEWTTVTSRFNFVDLAGSERLKRTSAQGERIKEGISINSGLLALGNVISALGDPARARQTTHVPYRDSKLTRLLQDSIGGNAHTLMIACISPTEYNLNESLNTLKYANRARNIKNRAEINEVEVGWEDVEYLQNLVTKLRGELSSLRNGGTLSTKGSMDTIAEEPARESGRLLDLQDKYSELTQKYAKLTAELVKYQNAPSPEVQRGPLSPAEFAMAVEPIAEEYEKSLSALESQLSLTKAALMHSEESMKEQEEQLQFEQQVNETNTNVISDLKSRIAKLAEREVTTETYVRDLEAKLKVAADNDEADGSTITELKKEVARYKEVQVNSEKYIKDLEARLATMESSNLVLKSQVDNLERDIERREEAYKELESRLNLLDTSSQQKVLLEELDERERKVLELERSLDDTKAEKEAIEREQQRLREAAKKGEIEKEELKNKLRSLEEEASRLNASSEAKTPVQSTSTSLADQSGNQRDVSTPTITTSTPPPSVDVGELERRLENLQETYNQTVEQLDVVNVKYRDSLKEIEDLAQQVEEARLVQSNMSATPSPIPSPSLTSTYSFPDGDPKDEEGDSVGSFPNLNGNSTVKRTRRSMPLQATNSRISFLGKPSSASQSHLRSVSLSQELSSAQGSRVSPSPSPRSISPVASRESLHVSTQQERSYESMKQEIIKLQDILKQRDDEILALERGLLDIAGPEQDSKGQGKLTIVTDSPAMASLPDEPARDNGRNTPPEQSTASDQAQRTLSPGTLSAFKALKQGLSNGRTLSEAADDHAARLDDLMRSMAKKESAHAELVGDLQSRLTTLQKQNEELRILSKNQVTNMSADIQVLRDQLSSSTTETTSFQEKLSSIEAELTRKNAELETTRTKAAEQLEQALREATVAHQQLFTKRAEEHTLAIQKLESEHAEDLRRMVAEREEVLAQKAAEYDAALKSLSSEHEAVLRKRDNDHEQALKSKDSEAEATLKRKADEHAEAIKQLEIERAGLLDSSKGEFTESFDKLKSEHASVLESRQADHLTAIEKLKAEHSTLLASLTESHEALMSRMRSEHDEAVTSTIRDHSTTLQRLRDDHDLSIKRTQEAHERALAEKEEDASRALQASTAGLEARLQAAATSHADELSSLRQDHATAIGDLKAAHSAALTDLDSQKAKELDAAIDALKKEHAISLDTLAKSHTESLHALRVEYEGRIKEMQSDQEQTIAELKKTHEGALAEQAMAHETVLSRSFEEHTESAGEAIRLLRDEHESAMHKIQESHVVATASLVEEHSAAIASVKAEHASMLKEQGAAHEAMLQQLTSSHSRELEKAREGATDASTTAVAKVREHEQTNERLLTQVSELKRVATTAEADRDVHARRGQDLERNLRKATEQHKIEIIKLESELAKALAQVEALTKSGDRVSPDGVDPVRNELREALDALSTLEKALIESQEERERLLDQLEILRSETQGKEVPQSKYDSLFQDLQETHRLSLTQMQFELSQTKNERDSLRAVGTRYEQELKDLQARVAAGSPTFGARSSFGPNGSDGSPLHAETESHHLRNQSQSDDEAFVDAPRSPVPPGLSLGSQNSSQSSTSTSAAPITFADPKTRALQNTSAFANGKPPPPTPPPSVPPPPVPTSAAPTQPLPSIPGVPGNAPANSSISSNPTRTSSLGRNSSQSNSNGGRSSTGSSGLGHAGGRNSGAAVPDSPPTSVRSPTNSMAESTNVTVDQRVLKKMEEQEAQIAKLQKQLTHCESDLQANIDLVTTLESALNDSERNLRKARMQMNDFRKERDQFQSQNENLRQELSSAQQEAENARQSVIMEQEAFQKGLADMRKAKTEAQEQLERRLDDMQARSRKSKFNGLSPFLGPMFF